MPRDSHSLLLAAAIVLWSAGTAPGQPAPAAEAALQPTPALVEDWRAADYAFSARMMAADLDDNIYVVGDTVVGDYVVVKKFSAAGALLWQATYDPAERLRGVWIAIDGSGNPVVLASIITGSSANPAGWLTLKYDADGALLWARGLPGPYRDARRVAIDASDNIYVAGRMWLTNPSANTTFDSVLIKYSPGGTALWTAVFDNSSAADEPYSLAISPDGSRIGVAGISGLRFMALMYDPDGNRLWARTGINADPANDLAFGPGNVSYFATGTYSPQDPNPYQMAIVKFDAAGNQAWIRSYNVGDRTLRVRVDGQGNVVAAGIDVVGYMDWMTIKTDPSGNLLWSRKYDGGRNNDEIPIMLRLDASGAVYVTGTGGPNPGSGNVSYLKGVVVKYSADGTPLWAVFDPWANGRAIALGAGNTLATLGFGYLVTTHYTETGLPDVRPAAPTNPSARVDIGLIDVGFVDHADNEFWVDVERCTGSGCTNFVKVGQTTGENAPFYRDRNVAAGVTYMYRLRAVGFMGASDYTVPVEAPGGPSGPAAPSNLAAVMSGANVTLTWQDNASDESYFYIERCQGAGCSTFGTVGWSEANVATWTDFAAAAGQSYSYRVLAWNVYGYSGYSNTATIVTPNGPPSPPLAPSNLGAQALNTTQIRLAWTNNSANQDLVKIERCRGLACTNFAQIAAVAGTATTYTDSGLARNTSYRYRVRAHNAAGDSPYSNTATARTSRR